MDHSHGANKSIKHYADAKRVPTRKVTSREWLWILCLYVFFISLSLTRRRRIWQRMGQNGDMKGEETLSISSLFSLSNGRFLNKNIKQFVTQRSVNHPNGPITTLSGWSNAAQWMESCQTGRKKDQYVTPELFSTQHHTRKKEGPPNAPLCKPKRAISKCPDQWEFDYFLTYNHLQQSHWINACG